MGRFFFTNSLNNKYWIAGNYFCEVEFSYIYHSSTEYEATLAKTEAILQQHNIESVIPRHVTVATSSTAEILKRKQNSLKYIHELRDFVKTGKHFDLDILGKYYKFSRIMKKFRLFDNFCNLLVFQSMFRVPK